MYNLLLRNAAANYILLFLETTHRHRRKPALRPFYGGVAEDEGPNLIPGAMFTKHPTTKAPCTHILYT